MRKLLASSVVLALLIGFGAGAVLISPESVNATYCVLEPESFIWAGGECLPENGNPKDLAYVRLYSCLGYWSGTTNPCECTYLGCLRPRPSGGDPARPGAG